MTKSMKAVRDRKTDNRRISQNMEKAFKKMAQVFGYPNREYKDRVFRMLLKDPKVALEVYNAMNGTSYDNPDELIITTLENAVYLGMKNDVSFILGTQLVLYEHQSTPNPNMPLRNLAYVACVYMEMPFPEAVEKAIDECIKKGILAEFLRKNRAEVLRVSIFEYDEEEHMRQEREESRQEGIEQVNDLYDKLHDLNREEDIWKAIKDVEYRKKLLEEFHLD